MRLCDRRPPVCSRLRRASVVMLAALGLSMLAGSDAWVAGAGADAGHTPAYLVTDLGTLGGSSSSASGINAAGQVVGTSRIAGDAATHAFLWEQGVMKDLGTLGGANSSADGINAQGQIVGGAGVHGTADYHPFLYSSGVMHDLGTLGGQYGEALAINDRGQVVGSATLAQDSPSQRAYHAFLYGSQGMQDLGTLGGDADSLANGINASGQVVGLSRPATEGVAVDRPILQDAAGLRDLGIGHGIARGINDAGLVVGNTEADPAPGGDARLSQDAFLYDAGGMRDLGVAGYATAVNAPGHVVGAQWWSIGAPENDSGIPIDRHAFLYAGGQVQDLNSLIPADSGWVLLEANAINEGGQIVGRGIVAGHEHAFLLTPPSAPPLNPFLTPSATSLPFDAQSTGSSSGSQSVTLTNNSTAPLTLGSLTLSGANPGDFAVTPGATTIAPGDRATLEIIFTPTAAGTRSAVLTVNSSALGAPPTVTLSGTGTPPPKYVLVDLGTDLGAPAGYNADLFSGRLRLSLNAAGVVAGWTPSADGVHAAVSDVYGTRDLGWLVHAPPGPTMATGINAAGEITGLSGDSNQSQAFVAQAEPGDGGAQALATPGPSYGGGLQALATPGVSYVAGHAINDAGAVVGLAVGPGLSGAFLYDSSGLHDLGSLGGGNGDAFAINHAGLVVGWSSTAGREQHAFLYDSAGMHDLGTLPGSHWSSALAINDAGQVVGQSYIDSRGYRAFLYDSAGMHDLGISGQAYGINNLGQIVGEADGAAQHAFLYTGGVTTDLNSLLPAGSAWVLTEADAINDAGQIVGLGTLNGQQHAFLLTFPADPRATPPAAPSGLVVSSWGPTGNLGLDWTDNNSRNEWGFEIQRKTAGGDWATITVTNRDNRTYVDTGLAGFTHYTYRVRALNGSGASDWSNEASGDTGTQGKLNLSASGPLDFGSQAAGTPSAPQTVTLTNSGNGPLTISSLTITGNVPSPVTTGAPATGSNPGEFAISPALTTPTTLGPGESLSVSLVFTPAAIGPRAAALTIADDAPGGGASVTLTGSGVGPVVRLIPDALDFGNEPLGLGTALAVLIQNKGNAPLTVSNIAFQGATPTSGGYPGDFSLATDGLTGQTLQPGDITLLNVRFSPTATGKRGATLVLTDDAADSPQSVALTGFGTAPLLQLSADSLVFGLQSGSSTQTLTLTNNGDAPLNIQGLALTGPDAGHFQILSDTGEQTLPVGGSRTVQIAFQSVSVAGAPHHAHIAAVNYRATLEIHDNDPHPSTAHTVALIATTDPGSAADTTPPPPPPGFIPATPPAAPSGLSAHAPSAGEVDLSWTDNSSNEQAFAIWRTGGGQDWVRVGIMGPHATSYTDPTVQPGVSYTYKVRAVNGGGASDWSNTVSLTPGAPPAAPTGLAADAAGSTVALTWSNQSTDEQAFAIWRQGGGSGWARVGIMGPGASTYTDPAVQPGTAYSYQVRAINRFGASGWSNQVSVTTASAPPAAPTGLAASVTGGQVTLTWTSQSTDEHAFAIWRQGGGQDWARVGIAGLQATSYADSELTPGTSYTYRVRAIGAGGASGWSNEVSVLVPAAP